eukprot:8485697-Pyramimonas_sp.AAC.1
MRMFNVIAHAVSLGIGFSIFGKTNAWGKDCTSWSKLRKEMRTRTWKSIKNIETGGAGDGSDEDDDSAASALGNESAGAPKQSRDEEKAKAEKARVNASAMDLLGKVDPKA